MMVETRPVGFWLFVLGCVGSPCSFLHAQGFPQWALVEATLVAAATTADLPMLVAFAQRGRPTIHFTAIALTLHCLWPTSQITARLGAMANRCLSLSCLCGPGQAPPLPPLQKTVCAIGSQIAKAMGTAARHDNGYIVSLASSLALALRSGRSTSAVAGVFL